MWRLIEIPNVSNALTLKQIFWKAKTFFKKLGYRFSDENTEIANATFPYKTDLSEDDVKINRIGNTKWTYHKERRFASTYLFFFFENFVSL